MPVAIQKDLVLLISGLVKIYEAGTVIFRRGEPSRHFYLVLSGQVKLDPSGTVAGPGSLLGVQEFFRQQPRPQTATAATRCHLALLDHEALARISRAGTDTTRTLLIEINQVLGGQETGEIGNAARTTDKYVTINCPVCGDSFEHIWISSRRFAVASRDTDLAPHYRDENGLVYAIIVCPRCRFAAYRDSFTRVKQEELPALRDYLTKHPEGKVDLTGRRTLEEGIQAMQLALGCYRVRPSSQPVVARLYHQLAWLYREAGEKEKEEEYLRQALETYEEVYLKGTRSLTSQLGEPGALYLIGELYYRLGHVREAGRWLEKAIYHPQIKQKPFIQNLARERWLEIREAVAAGEGGEVKA